MAAPRPNLQFQELQVGPGGASYIYGPCKFGPDGASLRALSVWSGPIDRDRGLMYIQAPGATWAPGRLTGSIVMLRCIAEQACSAPTVHPQGVEGQGVGVGADRG